MIKKILTLEQSDEWSEIVKSFKETDVYFYPEYCRAFYENGDGDPMIFYMEDESGRVANVFLKRDIHNDKRFSTLIPQGKFYDICSIYGYGGPLIEAIDFEKLQKIFDKEFTSFCKENSVVSDFVRFHCVYENQKFLEGNYSIENQRTTVYIDLSKGEQFIWDDFERNCKQNIKKAENSGIYIQYGQDEQLILKFKELYNQTMDRDNANSYYYFNEKFFNTTVEELKNNSMIFTANFEGKIIAACIIIFSDKLVHIHFAASDSEYLYLRPNNILFYKIALWACSEGKKILHIGGGVTGDNDNLFRFKKNFSKTNRLPFFIGRKIYDEVSYNELVKMRIENENNFDSDTKYFPKYRG